MNNILLIDGHSLSECPKTWQIFIKTHRIFGDNSKKSIDHLRSIIYHQYNGKINFKRHKVTFNTEADLMLFLMKYS